MEIGASHRYLCVNESQLKSRIMGARQISNSRIHLPLAGRLVSSHLNTREDKLYPLLACPGSKVAMAWYGEEHLAGHDAIVVSAESPSFKRYLYGIRDSCMWLSDAVVIPSPTTAPSAIAAIEVQKPAKRKAPAIVGRIYVTPECRRQGLATLLVQIALTDFPNLSLDGKLTADGAALFGYEAALARSIG